MSHIKKRGKILYPMFFVLLLLAIAVIIIQKQYFVLEHVVVTGNVTRSAENVLWNSGLKYGKNLFNIDEDDIKRSLKKDHLIIYKDMKIDFFNHTLYLVVEERQPVAKIAWPNEGVLLDKEGVVLSKDFGVNPKLPLISGLTVQSANIGQLVPVDVEQKLFDYQKIITALVDQNYIQNIEQINFFELDNIYCITRDKTRVLLWNSNNAHAKIMATRLILSHLQKERITGGTLDLFIPERAKYLPMQK